MLNTFHVKVKGSLGDYLIWRDMGADTLFYLNYDNDNLKLIPVLINNHSYFDNEYLDYPDDAFQTEQTLFILAQNRVLEFEKLDNDIVYYRDIYIEESLKNQYLSYYSNILSVSKCCFILSNQYSFSRIDKLWDNYRIAIYDRKTGKQLDSISLDLGKGIFTGFGMGQHIDHKNNKYVMSHPTKLEFYLLDSSLTITDTICLPKSNILDMDSICMQILSDDFLEENKYKPKNILNRVFEFELLHYPHIEKISFISDTSLLIQCFSQQKNDNNNSLKLSLCGERDIYIYYCKNKTFTTINYSKYKKILPFGLSESFFVDNNRMISSIWTEVRDNKLTNTLNIVKFVDGVDCSYPPPKTAKDINGNLVSINNDNYCGCIILNHFSCISCLSLLGKDVLVLISTPTDLPKLTKIGMFNEIKNVLPNNTILFINDNSQQVNYPFDVIIDF